MKKMMLSFFTFLTLILLTACYRTVKSTHHESNTIGTATLVVKFDQSTIKTFSHVPVKSNETVLEFLNSKTKVTMTSGVITKIDDISQVDDANLYWLFKIDGKLSNKGVTEAKVTPNSQIEFYLGNFK